MNQVVLHAIPEKDLSLNHELLYDLYVEKDDQMLKKYTYLLIKNNLT